MAMTEQEEYEYLSLKKKKAMAMGNRVQPSQPQQTIPQMLGQNFIKAGRETVQSAGVAANVAGFGLPGLISEKVSGKNIFEGGDLSSSQRFMASGAGMALPTGALLRPLGWAGKAVAGTRAGQAVGKTIQAPFRYAKNLIQGPGIAKAVANESKFNLAQKTDILARNISKTGDVKRTITEKKYDNIIRGYDELTEVLKKKIVKEGHREALNLQKQLPVLFRRKSLEFGAKRDVLIKGKNITVPANEVVGTMEEVLTYKGVLRFDEQVGRIITARSPMTSAEKQIYGLYKGTMKQLEENPGAVIDVEDILRAEKFAQPKFGKAWTPDDKLRANFSEKFSDAAEKYIPGYQQLKSDYAPYLQWKKQAIKETLPFSGKYETGKATGLISKVGSESLKPDEAHLLADLEKQIGRQVGGKVKTYQQGLKTIGEKQIVIKEEAKQILSKMKQDASDEVFKLRQSEKITNKQIDDAVNKLVNQYKSKRIKLGIAAGIGLTIATGGNLLKYFFRREIYSGIHGGY